jgi:uncharacterized protein (DUF1684 family)
MSNTVNAPFGLRPVYSPSGVVRPTAFTIATGYSENLFQNQPVRIAPTTAGAEAEGTLVAAAVGAPFIGVFQGVEFTDGDLRRRVSNRWLASTAATEIVAYATLDPTIVYEVQSNAALAVADIGKQYDLTAISGNTTTGLSTQALAVSSAAANASVRLIGITPGPDNAFGDTFVIAQVQISEHQFVANVAAI